MEALDLDCSASSQRHNLSLNMIENSQSESAGADGAAFFTEMVIPTVDQFLRDPADKRLGCLACLALSSMSDHFFHTPGAPVSGYRDADSYRRSHGKLNWAAGTVIGIANATKHVVRRPGRVGFADVFVDNISCGNLRCGWPINGREVMIEVAPNNLWLLSQLVAEAVRYWTEKLAAPLRERDPILSL